MGQMAGLDDDDMIEMRFDEAVKRMNDMPSGEYHDAFEEAWDAFKGNRPTAVKAIALDYIIERVTERSLWRGT